jgi:hypothetical protein
MNNATLRSGTRKAFAFTAYRALINIALLVALLHAFPGYETVSVLAVLAFLQGIAGLGLAVQFVATVQNSLADSAERKTRHTILLAADPDWLHADYFWSEVDRRVANEREVDDASPWWAQIGLTLLSFVGLLASDIACVVVAFVIANMTQ